MALELPCRRGILWFTVSFSLKLPFQFWLRIGISMTLDLWIALEPFVVPTNFPLQSISQILWNHSKPWHFDTPILSYMMASALPILPLPVLRIMIADGSMVLSRWIARRARKSASTESLSRLRAIRVRILYSKLNRMCRGIWVSVSACLWLIVYQEIC